MDIIVTRNMTICAEDGTTKAFTASDEPLRVGEDISPADYRSLKRVGAAVEVGTVVEVEEPEDLGDMTKAELLDRAKAAGVEVDAKANKADIIAALEGAGV